MFARVMTEVLVILKNRSLVFLGENPAHPSMSTCMHGMHARYTHCPVMQTVNMQHVHWCPMNR